MSRSRQTGFTLIELMVTVAIVGILAAIAYPSYQQYIIRSHRAEAKTILLESAQFMERYFTQHNRYIGESDEAPELPFQFSPRDAGEAGADYTITFAEGEPTASSYLLQAIPMSARQQTDACGTLGLNHQGRKTAKDGQSDSAIISECWGR